MTDENMFADLHRLGAALRQRWEEPTAQAALLRVVEALRLGQTWALRPDDLRYAEDVENGRDLRGAPLSGVRFPDADLTKVAMEFAVLRGANLSGADFRGSNLNLADLQRADLSHTRLERCFIQKANCRGTNLTGASLAGAVMTGSDLREAILFQADLCEAVLLGANLAGAELAGADLKDTRFGDFAPEP